MTGGVLAAVKIFTYKFMVHSWTAFESNFQDSALMKKAFSYLKGLCDAFVSYFVKSGSS